MIKIELTRNQINKHLWVVTIYIDGGYGYLDSDLKLHNHATNSWAEKNITLRRLSKYLLNQCQNPDTRGFEVNAAMQ